MVDPGAINDDGGPERVTKVTVFRTLDIVIFSLLSALTVCAIGYFVVTWISLGWQPHPLAYVMLSAALTAILINHQGRWFLLIPMRRPVPMTAAAGCRVAVVTTYVPGVETVEMLEHSLTACVAIDYPHDTWLLDEGSDSNMQEVCTRLGVRYFSRNDRSEYQTEQGTFRSGTKHGNYNAWLHEIGFRGYDFLLALDPDHLPISSFVSRTLGYFRDPAVGYVQAAQAFYNQSASVIARGAAEETYGYFSAVQMAAYGLDYPIIVGSHNSHRMSALESVGGFAAHDADDLLLTLKYRAAGWSGVYVPRILARGITPVDWPGYLGQQRRWARSVLEVKLQHRGAYLAKLPLRSRIMNMLHGINFLHRSFVFLGTLSVLVYLLAAGDSLDVFVARLTLPAIALYIALELEDLYRQRFFLDWRSEAGLHWRVALLDFAKWPWFLLAVIDVLRARNLKYAVTRKSPRSGLYWPMIVWNLGVAATVLLAWLVHPATAATATVIFVAAGIVVLASVALAASGCRAAPAPYRPGLWTPVDVPERRKRPRNVDVARTAKAT